LGRTTDSWRASQTRHRCRTNHRCKVYGEGKGTAVPRVEDFPSQSRRRHRVDGPIRGSDDLIPTALWVADTASRSPPNPVAGSDRGPTAEWISHQLTEAYGWKVAPRYIIRDRDAVYGDVFIRRLRAMSIRDRPTAPRSPWQNGYCERAIGSIRRECLDHVVVFGERHLRHLLRSYATYYNAARTHLSVNKDPPLPRTVHAVGRILPTPFLGGLHHLYVRV